LSWFNCACFYNTCHVDEPEKAPSKPSNQTTLQRQHYENTGGFDDRKVAEQAQIIQEKILTYFVVIFYVEWFWVRGGRFVDIGGVVDHHSFHKQLKYGLHV
jgi:hypothetical protein